MISKAEVLNLVFINPDLCGSMNPSNQRKCVCVCVSACAHAHVHVHVCVQGEALSHSLDFQKVYDWGRKSRHRSYDTDPSAGVGLLSLFSCIYHFHTQLQNPAFASIWGKTHHESLTWRKTCLMESLSCPYQSNKQTASQLTPGWVQNSIPVPFFLTLIF